MIKDVSPRHTDARTAAEVDIELQYLGADVHRLYPRLPNTSAEEMAETKF